MSDESKAAYDNLCELHGTLARTLKDAIVAQRTDPNPALLSVARAFLKDNRIEADPKKNEPLRELEDLPEFTDDDTNFGDGAMAH